MGDERVIVPVRRAKALREPTNRPAGHRTDRCREATVFEVPASAGKLECVAATSEMQHRAKKGARLI